MREKVVADYMKSQDREPDYSGVTEPETERVPESTYEAVAGEDVIQTAVVVGENGSTQVKIRNAPNIKTGVPIGTIAVGQKVRVHDKIDGFYKISTPSTPVGYIIARLLKLD